MGEDIISTRTTQHWFNRCKNGNLELDDIPSPGRPLEGCTETEILGLGQSRSWTETDRDLARDSRSCLGLGTSLLGEELQLTQQALNATIPILNAHSNTINTVKSGIERLYTRLQHLFLYSAIT
ncbi:unnamed protein product [Adineta ricciae]|uniref:Mos1 transposase HTH domain-containing protein n=1 Tax=Adineta ricciae TaxID=249248 RepID=A0A816E2J0_ADIRI|nr:unnamed protein product [Adineta ricciae]